MFRALYVRIRTDIRQVTCCGGSNSVSSAKAGKCKQTDFQEGRCLAFLSTKIKGGTRMATLETLKFDNLALRSLPIDSEDENYVRQVPGACFSRVNPTPVENPALVAYSTSAMSLLDLGDDQLQRPETVDAFSGNVKLKGSETAAHCYCGHQFGHFSGQLGDGAAIYGDLEYHREWMGATLEIVLGYKALNIMNRPVQIFTVAKYLGEVINKKGERWEIQLKGAGLTPYSRTADGRKVLRSSIREFLCSEAMYFLGIPTTRAGMCVTSDSTVMRDIFYNGNAVHEKCTLVLRMAPSFLRFGSYEIFKPTDSVTGRRGPSVGKTEILPQMLDYTVQTFYPEIWNAHSSDKPTVYLEFFKEIMRRTARLVAEWQCAGFCHGVLNTDNMSAVGVTIDYGPYGFMDAYDPGYICNGSDDGGRYAYDQQPAICKWNCLKLAEAIQTALPLSTTTPELDNFMEEYDRHYMEKMRKKLGLLRKLKDSDKDLIAGFLNTMHKTGADFTNAFRCLSDLPLPGCTDYDQKEADVLQHLLSQCSTIAEMKQAVSKPRMNPRQFQMFMMILQSNPELLEQLGGAQKALLQELERIEKQKELEGKSEDTQKEMNAELWRSWLSQYSARLKEEADEAEDVIKLNKQRLDVMDKTNPRFVLRNYIAQNAITAAENGDYSEVRRVLKLLENPYSRTVELGDMDSTGQTSASADDDTGLRKSQRELTMVPVRWD